MVLVDSSRSDGPPPSTFEAAHEPHRPSVIKLHRVSRLASASIGSDGRGWI